CVRGDSYRISQWGGSLGIDRATVAMSSPASTIVSRALTFAGSGAANPAIGEMAAGYRRASAPPSAKCACPVVRLDQKGLSRARRRSEAIIAVILSRYAAAGRGDRTIRSDAVPARGSSAVRDCGQAQSAANCTAQPPIEAEDDHRLSPGDLALRANCLADGGAR